MKIKPAICVALALGVGLPIAVVMGWFPVPSGTDVRLLAARIERGMALLFAGFALIYGAYRYFKGRGARSRLGAETTGETGASITSELIPGGKANSVRKRDVLLAVLPSLPLVLYLLIFTMRAFDALFLVDLDFTGISSAMNNTAKGNGLLTTPFFQTGTSGSYLGHHFSPTLLLYVPFYFIADLFSGIGRSSHLIYGMVLWATFTAGVLAWARLLVERLGDAALAGALLAAFMLAYPVQRLILSFHYELPAFACSALVFIALREHRPVLLWCALLGWIGVKEDAALYVFLFSVALATVRTHRSTALRMALFTLVYFVLANLVLRPYFGGGQGPAWNYWKGGPLDSVMTLVYTPGMTATPGLLLMGVLREIPGVLARLPYGSLLDLLPAFAFLPLLSPRLFVLTLMPIFALHLVSGHAWHATFYGHYSYSVLPFLMLGALHGFTVLLDDSRRPGLFIKRKWGVAVTASLVLAVAAYSAAGDKETPLPPSPPDARLNRIASIIRDLPPGSCLRTQTFFTALAPLDLYVFPLEIPRGNPARDRLPPQAPYAARGSVPVAPCREFYILLDTERYAPYYSRAYMERFRGLVERGVSAGELELVSVPGARLPRLYRATRNRAPQ